MIGRKLAALIDENDTTGVLELLQESIGRVSNNEINFLITKAMVNLDRKRVNIDIITGIIVSVASNNLISVDSVTYTSYMDILNRRGKYEETLHVFNNIQVTINHSTAHIYSRTHSSQRTKRLCVLCQQLVLQDTVDHGNIR